MASVMFPIKGAALTTQRQIAWRACLPRTAMLAARKKSTTSNENQKVCVLGSGSWGTTIAKVVGENVQQQPGFDNEVRFWVRREMIGERPLAEIINTEHVNTKYLPGVSLPSNVLAVESLGDALQQANTAVVVVPGQFLDPVLAEMQAMALASTTNLISLIKGYHGPSGTFELVTDRLKVVTGTENTASVMMGANIAAEVAQGQFCEATVGCRDPIAGKAYQKLFETPSFHINVVKDVVGVELCGTLKNVVALGTGFAVGSGFGYNTRAALMRIGLIEMAQFSSLLYPDRGIEASTFVESCGVADLIATCCGGRNMRVAEAYAKTGKGWDELEADLLNGQKLQGLPTCREVYTVLSEKNMLHRFPLFHTIYRIAFEGLPANQIASLAKTDSSLFAM